MFALLAQAGGKIAENVPDSEAVQAPNGWLIFWLIVAVIFVPYLIGSALAGVLKLKEFSSRIGTVLFMLSACLAPFVYRLSNGDSFSDCFRLGIDLAGGTNLVYEIDQEQAKKKEKSADEAGFLDASLDNMVGAIARRVNPSGTEEVTIRRAGKERIEIIIPGADQAYVDEMKDRITRLGTLEFEILATRDKGAHKQICEEAADLPPEENDVVIDGYTEARWVDVVPKETITNTSQRPVPTRGDSEDRVLPAEERPIRNEDGEEIGQQALVILSTKEDRVSGEFLIRARDAMDPQTGRPIVTFQFDGEGGNRMRALTTEYRPSGNGKHRLAILLDGKIQSAPSLNTTIEDRGQIEGQFTVKEVQELVNVLNAGALDVPLNPIPISEFTISPTLGRDVRKKGVYAIQVSAILVVLFMAFYYKGPGLVAVLCLTLNLVLIMGMMVFVQGTFTLPGLAGLVLTIGMAVDANVLIFERIREELNRGSSKRMAIHNGFDKAFSAIIDSNLTTLIVAVVLFMIGTDQVKGFAVTLFIGIVMSMFSALYFGRSVFEVLEKKRLLGNLSMRSVVNSPDWDFVGKRKIAFLTSAVLILVGMGSFVLRGSDNLDIDFRGGTMVTFEFTEDREVSDFRPALEKEFGTITVERLTVEGESQASDAGRRWRLRTTEQSEDTESGREKVEKKMASALGTDLTDLMKKVEMSHSELTRIAPHESTDAESSGQSESGYQGGWQTTLTFSERVTKNKPTKRLNKALGLDETSNSGKQKNLFRILIKGSRNLETDISTTMELQVRPQLTKDELESALKTIEQEMAETPKFDEVQTFSTAVGDEMKFDAITAMVVSLFAIVAYIWLRFRRVTFGLAAVAALVHDVLVVLGVTAMASYLSGSGPGQLLGFYDFKINLPMIAAFLTIVGYSLNDTIVIFDRIREVRGKDPSLTSEMINRSLNQTLARTLLTSATTFIVVAILYVFGGEGIHGFAFCLLVGVLVGTYSSIYVASPVLLWLMNRAEKAGAGTARA